MTYKASRQALLNHIKAYRSYGWPASIVAARHMLACLRRNRNQPYASLFYVN